jgi:WD40 repeat protein
MKAVAKLAAPVRGIDIVLLVDKDYAEHQRTVRQAWTAVALLAGLLVLALGLFARSRHLEEAEREQRVQTQANESRLLASLSRTEAARNNAVGAALLSLRGLPAANDPEPRRPVVEEAVRSLQDAIYAYGASRLVWTFEGHAGQRQALSEIDDVRSINKVSFSPDGTRVLTASPDATARVLDATTGGDVFSLRHRFEVHDSTYSPDGRFIVTGSADGLASIWNAADGKNIGNLNHWEDKDCGSGLTNIESSVGRVSVSPDSRRVLTRGRIGRRLWSLASPGQPVCEGATVLDAYDPSATYGLSMEETGFTIVTIADGKTYLHIEGQSALVPGIAFAPDGKQVLAGFRDGRVELWNLETKTKKELRLPANEGIGLTAFDGAGAAVVFTSNGEEIAIWDVERSTADWRIPLALLGPGAEATAIVTGPPVTRTTLTSGQVLIALFNQRKPSAGARGLLIDRKTGGVLAQLLHPSGPIVRASFSPDGRRLVTGSKRGTVSLWDTSFADVGKVERMGNSPSIVVRASSHDPAQVLTASRDGRLRAWNIDTGKDEWTVPAGFGPLEDAQLSAGGRYLALRDETGRLRVVAIDPTRSLPLQAEGDDVGAMAFDGPGERLIIGQRDGSVWLWQLTPRLDKRKLYQTQAPTRYVGVSRRGAHGLSGHGQVTLRRDNNLYVWAVMDPARAVPLHGHSLPVLGGEIHEGAGRALSFGMDGVVFLWDLKRIDAALAASGSSETIEPLARIIAGQPPSTGDTFLPSHVQAVFSNDGACFVTVGDSAAIWNSADGLIVAHLRGHVGAIKTAAFNADGTLVATAGTDTTVRVWRVESGAEVFVFRGHTRPVRALSFAGHAQSIVSASDDGTVRVWESQARPETLVRTALDILPRKQLTRAEQLLVEGAPLR